MVPGICKKWVFVVGDFEALCGIGVELSVIDRIEWPPGSDLGAAVINLGVVVGDLIEDVAATRKTSSIESAVDPGCHLLNIVVGPVAQIVASIVER